MEPLRLCLWSGPRNVSTALMYSFAQRPDTRVVDEPLYAHYLRVTGVEHPARDEVLAAQENDGEKVVRQVILGPCDRQVLFLKLMAHHLVDLDRDFLKRTTNILLVRDPQEMLRSLSHQIPEPGLADTGLAVASELFEQLRGLGQDPLVLESRQVLLDPKGVLRQLCARVGIPFFHEMMSWEGRARPEDGVWGPWWYHNVHRSTGFKPYRPKSGPFPNAMEAVLAACRPHYEALFAHAVRAETDPESRKSTHDERV
jgi:hypothetical protein